MFIFFYSLIIFLKECVLYGPINSCGGFGLVLSKMLILFQYHVFKMIRLPLIKHSIVSKVPELFKKSDLQSE